jgi:hypothetical protein
MEVPSELASQIEKTPEF